jgi:hypothetical protein
VFQRSSLGLASASGFLELPFFSCPETTPTAESPAFCSSLCSHCFKELRQACGFLHIYTNLSLHTGCQEHLPQHHPKHLPFALSLENYLPDWQWFCQSLRCLGLVLYMCLLSHRPLPSTAFKQALCHPSHASSPFLFVSVFMFLRQVSPLSLPGVVSNTIFLPQPPKRL